MPRSKTRVGARKKRAQESSRETRGALENARKSEGTTRRRNIQCGASE